MQATPEVKTRPVLPHTFGRWDEDPSLTREQRRELKKLGRKRGRPYKVQPIRTKGKG
ncbi:hypothetical protein SEA_GREENHEARTS_61 [Arthrobacter phage GreenHearts]|uniref:Uncharacterized protein n=1 Tax=Arthrobacter phage GreenHearts TaxID=2499003 RepID=A0A3S9UCK3_9CAUD|nr:hypothetical protein KDI97_gp61 [Arthrobacter phage GreenHearts]AZS08040.1 hypothetical protein SEA_GREENHEARTS_61 [Arthrobacter phage GreenHearts]